MRGEHAWLESGAMQVIPDGVSLAPRPTAPVRGPREENMSDTRETTQVGAGG